MSIHEFPSGKDPGQIELMGRTVRLPEQGNSNSHGTRPVHQSISMISGLGRASCTKELPLGRIRRKRSAPRGPGGRRWCLPRMPRPAIARTPAFTSPQKSIYRKSYSPRGVTDSVFSSFCLILSSLELSDTKLRSSLSKIDLLHKWPAHGTDNSWT